MAKASTVEPTDAITLLKADHRAVEALFAKFEAAEDGAKEDIAQNICLELMVHATIEEEIVYPAVKDVIEEELYNEAHVEHDGAKMLIAEILVGSIEDGFYVAKVKVLSEEIKHHVKEEEQSGGMFEQAKEGGADLKGLGLQMAQRKTELSAEYEADGIPNPTTRSMKGVVLEIGEPAEPAEIQPQV